MSDQLTAEAFDAAYEEVMRDKPPKSPGLCRLAVILRDNPALQPQVMDVARYDGTTVARVLKGLGLPVSRDVVNKHRKGTCVCQGVRQSGGHR